MTEPTNTPTPDTTNQTPPAEPPPQVTTAPAAAPPKATAPPEEDPKWFRDRLAQAKRASERKLLGDLLGVEDVGEAQRTLEELRAAREKLKEIERTQMSEIERANADREEALQAMQEMQSQLEAMSNQQVVQEVEMQLQGIASGYIRPDMVEDALDRLQVHCQGMSDDELDEFDPEEFLAELAVNKPAYALVGDEPEAPEADAAPPQEPAPTVTVQKRPNIGNDPPARLPAKNPPAAPNYSKLNNTELNKELAKLGLAFRFTERPGQK